MSIAHRVVIMTVPITTPGEPAAAGVQERKATESNPTAVRFVELIRDKN
jgi:hypothetical protein